MSVTTVWAIPSGTNSPPAEVIDPVIVERFPYSSSSKTTVLYNVYHVSALLPVHRMSLGLTPVFIMLLNILQL